MRWRNCEAAMEYLYITLNPNGVQGRALILQMKQDGWSVGLVTHNRVQFYRTKKT